jgi:hypothetical protein
MANKTVTVIEADGTQTDVEILDVNRQAAALSKSVALSNEDRTSLVNLEASASVLDDWDETDRAKVNLIVGQAGVDAGPGAVTVKTLRIHSATDDPLLTAVQGVAHGASAASVNPSLLGTYALAHGANPTAVAAGQASKLYGNRHGIPWMIGGHPNVISTEFTVTDADGPQNNLALVTIGAGNKIVVTQAQMSMNGANSVNVGARLGLAAATLPAAALAGAAGIILSGKFGANGGISRGVGGGIIAIGADGEDLRLTCDDPVGGDIRIAVSYYTIES